MTEKIVTQHPEAGKRGVRIDRSKYDLLRSAIIELLREHSEMKPMALYESAAEKLEGQMEGSIKWYAVTVKLDMEAKGEVIHDRKRGRVQLQP